MEERLWGVLTNADEAISDIEAKDFADCLSSDKDEIRERCDALRNFERTPSRGGRHLRASMLRQKEEKAQKLQGVIQRTQVKFILLRPGQVGAPLYSIQIEGDADACGRSLCG